ncbi:MAG: succinate dehydrogenase iron-sulfur subunit [Candidatus Omnitrophica bacterium]|nr:succinate dehydrogenase iron-sulfur subunit [Candidatus Omnitrophota bacterium]
MKEKKPEKVIIRIKRQESPEAKSYWEEYYIPYRPYLNIITCLQGIRKTLRTFDGRPTTPVAWESSCLEEICGICTMVINGRVRQACSALVDQLEQPITLEPMKKFSLVRDLIVDRSSIFENLKRVKAWVPMKDTQDRGPGPKILPKDQQINYALSRCFSCGACLEVCPQVNERNDFVGAAILSQARLFNRHPIGKEIQLERLKALVGEGGIEDCGNAQNCLEICPKDIPLIDSIAEINREITFNLIHLIKGK